MKFTTVIDIATLTAEKAARMTESGDLVYVGRRASRSKIACARKASPLANPFKSENDEDLAEVLKKYLAHIQASPDLMAMLPALKGKTLACWCCRDLMPITAARDEIWCHAQVLARLADGCPGLPE